MSFLYDLDSAVVAMLEEATGKAIYLVKVPPDAEDEYIVLYPQFTLNTDGSFADPEEDRDYTYQVTSVGQDVRQTRWLQSKVMEGFLGRGANGYEFEVENSQWRSSTQLGAIVPSGDKLFQADDTYRVRAGR